MSEMYDARVHSSQGTSTSSSILDLPHSVAQRADGVAPHARIQRLGSGCLPHTPTARSGTPNHGSYRSKSGGLMGSGPHALAEQHSGTLQSLGSGSLIGLPDSHGYLGLTPDVAVAGRDGQIPALRFAAGQQYAAPAPLQQPANLGMELGAGAPPFAGAVLGTPFGAAPALAGMGGAEESVLPPSQLHAHAMPFAPASALTHSAFLPQLPGQSGGEGTNALFPVGKQLAPRGSEAAGGSVMPRGITTLPPAAALEGGVHESEMANDESLHWRRAHA